MIENNLANREAELAHNIAQVRAHIAEAAERAGRSPHEITLVAVSKTKPLELVEAAYRLGITDFGENRVQEALQKIAAFHPQGIRWHMIGHVQSNKATKVAPAFDWVQSVDSLHVAQALDRYAAQRETRLPVLLEVNIAGEESKEGTTPAQLPALVRQMLTLSHLEVQGLMTVAPQVENPEEVRWVFRALRLLREQLHNELPGLAMPHLSMGMTDDYQIAIEEGATIVRVGRAIFGERERVVK